jgi:hypothetical protein
MIARRNALRLGLAASAVALSGRGTARAADALTIGPNGVNIDNLQVAKSLTVSGPMKIDSKNTMEFGAGVSGKQVDAGKIGYQTWTTDALDIVGAGTAGTNRRIKFWAEGGATLAGSLTVSGDATLQKSLTVSGDATLQKSLTVSGPIKIDGKNTLEFGQASAPKKPLTGRSATKRSRPAPWTLSVREPRLTGRTGRSSFTLRGATLAGSLTVSGGGGTNVDLMVNGRLRSDNNDGGLWVTSNRFVGGCGTDKIGFWDGDWRLVVSSNGQLEVPGELFVRGRVVYWWGPDGAWKKLENRANDYAGSYSTSGPSDVRFKTALRPISNALEKVLQLNGTCYRWGESGIRHFTQHITDEFSAGPDTTADDNQKLWDAERQKAHQALSDDKIGLIAQELETVVPELVHEDQEGYKYIQYPQLTALLVEAIKEQNALLQSLSGKLAALEGR